MKKTCGRICLKFLLIFLVGFGGPGLAFGSIVDLSLIPSATNLVPGENFDIAVWLYPGNSSTGTIDLSSAEFNVTWDTLNLQPQSGVNPTLGFSDIDGISIAEWAPANPTGAAHVSATFLVNESVGSAGLNLMNIPLIAGNLIGQANLSFDLFMESSGPGEYTIQWDDPSDGLTSATGLDISNISATGTSVNIDAVPIPGAVWLLSSGLLSLAGFRRKFSNKLSL